MSRPQPQSQDPALLAQQPLPTQPFLAPQAVEWMLVCFAQDPQLFAEARGLVTAHHFDPQEAPLRLVYEAMCRSTDQHGGSTYETLAEIAGSLLSTNQSFTFDQLQLDTIFRRDEHGLIWQVCNPTGVTINDVNKSFARSLLQRFAYERTVVNPLRRVLNPSYNRGVPENLQQFLGIINTQQARLSTLQAIPEVSMTPAIGTPLQPAYRFKPTGVTFVDEPLGGQRVGDCNGIIGPTGGGKTTFATHMTTAMVRQCWADAQTHGTQPEIVVFVTVEESALKLRPRLWSSFFQIQRSKAEGLSDWGLLTAPGQLDHYELQMQANQEYKLSEVERYQAYAPQLEQCLRVLDLSGSDEHPTAGRGYIPEIVSYLSRYQSPIRAVFIDYAGLLCQRYIQSQGLEDSSYRTLLQQFGDRCRIEIAERFQCTVWALHQLKAELGKSSPTKLMHHSDAGESKDFAVNMAVCGCLGVADQATGCRRLNWSKIRYRPTEQVPPTTLRINENFAIMEDVTRLYTIDDASRQFLSFEEQRQVHGTETLQRRREMVGPQIPESDLPM